MVWSVLDASETSQNWNPILRATSRIFRKATNLPNEFAKDPDYEISRIVDYKYQFGQQFHLFAFKGYLEVNDTMWFRRDTLMKTAKKVRRRIWDEKQDRYYDVLHAVVFNAFNGYEKKIRKQKKWWRSSLLRWLPDRISVCTDLHIFAQICLYFRRFVQICTDFSDAGIVYW